MKNNLRKELKQRGITLIALVVTIIVLIILAGVSFNLIMGENGLFAHAKASGVENTHGAVHEKLMLAIADHELQVKLGNRSDSFIDYLKERLILDNSFVVDVEELLGQSLSAGNGDEENGDYYQVVQDGTMYKVIYYGAEKTPEWEKELVTE